MTYLVIVIILGVIRSRSPGSIDVTEYAMQQVGQHASKLE
jgi:hypothetical protein